MQLHDVSDGLRTLPQGRRNRLRRAQVQRRCAVHTLLHTRGLLHDREVPCPAHLTNKGDGHLLTCVGLECYWTSMEDISNCCPGKARCFGLLNRCPEDTALHGNAEVLDYEGLFCGEHDYKTCCVEKGKCNSYGRCPVQWALRPSGAEIKYELEFCNDAIQ